jgi:hypothetical protein
MMYSDPCTIALQTDQQLQELHGMTVINQPRIINGNTYEMPTVDGMDRCQINTRLHYLNVEIDKLKAKQSALITMRDQLDRHAEMQEMGNLFDEMFGG